MSNRQIKFRGLTLKTRRWACGGIFFIGLRAFIILDDCEILNCTDIGATKLDDYISDFVEVDPATVGQFIDRKTSDGTELFEGDIVQDNSEKHKLKTGVIIWDCIQAAFVIKGEEFYDMMGEKFSWWELKVIGNIHKNPEGT